MSSDAFDLLKRLRMDLTAAQAKITDLQKVLTELNIKDTPRPKCPKCGISFKSSSARDEHVYHTHDGPVPPAWVAAEELAARLNA